MEKRSYLSTFIALMMLFPFLFVFCRPPAVAVEKYVRNSIQMEFVLIPKGTFLMGSPPGEPNRDDDETLHQVVISEPFYLQTAEVTVKQWQTLMGKKMFERRTGPDNLPMAKISWHDCMKFIKKLNALGNRSYRLPTEAEWEYAARGGTRTPYSWGRQIDCSKAMYGNNRHKSQICLEYVKKNNGLINMPAPVKSYEPNSFGIYDMHGNVWEWCLDWYGPYPFKSTTDPFGLPSGTYKVRRGGSWFKHGDACRSANRNYAHPASRYRTTGFRLVIKSLDDEISDRPGP